jgi:hypothetical protein
MSQYPGAMQMARPQMYGPPPKGIYRTMGSYRDGQMSQHCHELKMHKRQVCPRHCKRMGTCSPQCLHLKQQYHAMCPSKHGRHAKHYEMFDGSGMNLLIILIIILLIVAIVWGEKC